MSTFDDDTNSHLRWVSRLAALQSLREQAQANDRQTVLKTINDMIEAELRALKEKQSHDDKPPSGNASHTERPRAH